jgi:hypothetical protein
VVPRVEGAVPHDDLAVCVAHDDGDIDLVERGAQQRRDVVVGVRAARRATVGVG